MKDNIITVYHGTKLWKSGTILRAPCINYQIERNQSIEESISYLNNSVVFVASMSGYAQFASNCSCGVIQIGDPKLHIEYDPFEKGAIAVELKDIEPALRDFLV